MHWGSAVILGPCVEKVNPQLGEAGDGAIQQRYVDLLPLAGLLAVIERRENSIGAIHCAKQIHNGHSHGSGPTVGRSIHRVEARNSLRQQILSRPTSVWAIRAVSSGRS